MGRPWTARSLKTDKSIEFTIEDNAGNEICRTGPTDLSNWEQVVTEVAWILAATNEGDKVLIDTNIHDVEVLI